MTDVREMQLTSAWEVMMKKQTKERVENVCFTLPALICIFVMFYIPFVMGAGYSFTQWNGISQQPKFIGLDNYKAIFGGGSGFFSTIGFTIGYTALFILFSNVIALILAVALTKKFHLANVFRGVFFIPYIMSMTIVGFIWKFIFTKGFETMFEHCPLPFFNWSWLGDPRVAFWAVTLVGIWQSLGFYIVLYIAGLEAVPQDVEEAARVDGATSTQRFFRVTLPLLGPSITTCIFMSLTNGLKVFDIILALTKGGPGQATYSATMSIYMDAFTNNQYGLGSAEAIVYFLVVLVITKLTLKGLNRTEVSL